LAPAFAFGADVATPARVLDFDWVDARRNRAVPCRLYLPARTAAGDRNPLVVFSHGLGGSRTGYRYLGSYLAEHGVASIHPQHVGSDRQLWASGSPFALLERLNGASSDSEALARVADLRFVLDQVFTRGAARNGNVPENHEALASIDPQAIVVAGHSYGANTAMLVAGAQVEREGKPVPLRDERIRAAVLISAPPFYGEQSPARILAAIRIPTLHITSTEDLIRIPGMRSGLEDRIAVFDATASRFKCLAVFEGGSHSVFTDRFGSGDYESNVRIKQATRELCLAFLQALGSALPGFLAPSPREAQPGIPHAPLGSASDDLARWEKRHASLLHRFVRRS
jgi:pimeloyl-ACP methyl ester carboxylesterase